MTIECVPNVSEGRRLDVVDAIAQRIAATEGVRLLDFSADPAHNRSVFTFVGPARALESAVLELFDAALRTIDLRTHCGEHPRIGAVDVVPFVPLGAATMAESVALARHVAALVAERFAVPVFLYEDAAVRPERRRLEAIRRGGLEQLAARMQRPDWAPDFGPAGPHPSAGATVIGARMPLVAFNVNLDTDRLDVAEQIARAIRESSGGMPFVKAIAVRLADGTAQVSTNATNYHVTPLAAIFQAVEREAGERGCGVRESEIVGLVPAAALPADPVKALRLAQFRPAQVLETHL
jgi:glutamate formiminotransferase